MKRKCWRLLFEGRVQGVGFRFTSRHKAEALGIKGWVKNLADGRVEIEAEAEEESLRRLIEGLRESFGSFIYSYTLEEKSCGEKFDSFEIRF